MLLYPNPVPPLHYPYNAVLWFLDTKLAYSTLCKKASNHHANLPLEMYSFTL